MSMLRMELLRLLRNNLSSLIFGYIATMVAAFNLLTIIFGQTDWMEQWNGRIAIFLVTIMLDMIFWLTALPIAEDAQTQMIQVMRTSRSIVQYFIGKHALLLLLATMFAFGLMALRLHDPGVVFRFVHLTILISLTMIGFGVAITTLFKQQTAILTIGSFVNVLALAVLLRMILPTWNIPPIPFNPFEYLIQPFYDLLDPPLGIAAPLPLLQLSLFAVVFYLTCLTLFYHLTYRQGYRL
ncbi:hypothetical protein LOK74_02205 [Brevibacillus humidisoli]|uniref:hypothetical protein n=1 Tax=Brevibacillus humidisoli TaxID=2895522 RepID=UPI001E409388|nr:hypothetical protein [Brevibacillus humidisoli]UFJ41372.1 hypothetical protein LOK74_02205 [Brevibacillus humidisoli]